MAGESANTLHDALAPHPCLAVQAGVGLRAAGREIITAQCVTLLEKAVTLSGSLTLCIFSLSFTQIFRFVVSRSSERLFFLSSMCNDVAIIG